jgi:hypothetical protein
MCMSSLHKSPAVFERRGQTVRQPAGSPRQSIFEGGLYD